MRLLIYAFATVFMFLSLVLALYTYPKNGHPGVLILSAIYGISAVAAIMLVQAWPLLLGFVLAWIVRLSGLEPPGPGQDKTDGGA